MAIVGDGDEVGECVKVIVGVVNEDGICINFDVKVEDIVWCGVRVTSRIGLT
jgi:hypothetical protein